MIYFDLLFMRLSKSYDSSYVFCELSEVESSCFIMSYFYIEFFKKIQPLTMGLLKIRLHNLFWFVFYKVISVLWP